jgi:probable rRNA maturation factor
MSDDPSSSSPGRAALSALPGLTFDFDMADTGLGEAASVRPLVETAVAAALLETIARVAVPMELGVRLVDNAASQALNRDFRGKDRPTNVLSFPGTEPDDIVAAFDLAEAGGPPVMLGDLVIAGPVVVREAGEQGKRPAHHLTHLCIHGVLHLMGFDHIEDEDAEEMEALEREILAGLGIDDPYALPQEMMEEYQ